MILLLDVRHMGIIILYIKCIIFNLIRIDIWTKK